MVACALQQNFRLFQFRDAQRHATTLANTFPLHWRSAVLAKRAIRYQSAALDCRDLHGADTGAFSAIMVAGRVFTGFGTGAAAVAIGISVAMDTAFRYLDPSGAGRLVLADGGADRFARGAGHTLFLA